MYTRFYKPAVAALTACCLTTAAQAQILWDGDTSVDDDWFLGSNWDSGLTPTSTDDLRIQNGANPNPVVINNASTAEANSVTLSYNAGEENYLQIDSDLTVTDALNVTRRGIGGVTHNAGTVTANEIHLSTAGGDSTYTMTSSSAIVNVNNIQLGRGDGTASFIQNAGQVTTNTINGANGQPTAEVRTYNMNGGTLLVNDQISLNSRGHHLFVQTGGTTTVTNDFLVGTADDPLTEGTIRVSDAAILNIGGSIIAGSNEPDRFFGRGNVILDGAKTDVNAEFTAMGFELRNDDASTNNPTPPASVFMAIVDQAAIDTPGDMFMLEITGNVTFEEGSILFPEFDPLATPEDGSWTILTWTDTLDNQGTGIVLDSSAEALGWSFVITDLGAGNGGQLDIFYAAIPEPTAGAFLLSAAALLAFRRRRSA